MVSDPVSVLKNEVCSTRVEERLNEPDRFLAKPLTSEPARDNEPVRVLDSEIVRPLKREVAIDSEPLKPLNSEVWSINAEDELREPDRDLAKPLISEPVRPSEPATVLCREM